MTLIREALPKDNQAIFDLIVELAEFEKERDGVINTPSALYEDLFESKRCYALVAEKADDIVGFALYFFAYSTWKGPTLYLEDIYIKESHRRQNIGQMLFDQVLIQAKVSKVKRMDWQVLDWNTPAIDFYKKNEAHLDATWINGRLYFD